MNEEPLDLHRFRRAIARGRWIVIWCIVAGLVAAAIVSLIRVPRYSANTVVLLPASGLDAAGQPTRDIQTEVQIASSADALEIARRGLRPPLSIDQLRRRLSVSAPTTDILRFNAKAGSKREAIRIANATASAYRDYSVNSVADQTRRVVAGLQARITDLREQILTSQAQIAIANAELASAPQSPKASANAARVASLRAQQDDLSSQLRADLNQVTQANLNSDAASTGIRLISRATTASNGAARALALNLALGAIGGLLLGVTIVLARDSRSRLLRRGADIAAAAGVPAVASITTHCPRRPSDWLAVLENYEASADESWNLRRLLRALVAVAAPSPAHLTIVTLPRDDGALGVAPQLATFAAGAGLRTVLIAGGNEPTLMALRQARDVVSLSAELPRANLSIVDATPDDDDGSHTELFLSMIVADRSVLDIEPAPATTLLAVSAGAATPEQIAGVATAAADAGCPLAGVVVANPEPDEDSDGDLANSSRSLRTLLPNHIPRAQRGSAS